MYAPALLLLLLPPKATIAAPLPAIFGGSSDGDCVDPFKPSTNLFTAASRLYNAKTYNSAGKPCLTQENISLERNQKNQRNLLNSAADTLGAASVATGFIFAAPNPQSKEIKSTPEESFPGSTESGFMPQPQPQPLSQDPAIRYVEPIPLPDSLATPKDVQALSPHWAGIMDENHLSSLTPESASHLESGYLQEVPIKGLNHISDEIARSLDTYTLVNLRKSMARIDSNLHKSAIEQIQNEGTEGLNGWLVKLIKDAHLLDYEYLKSLDSVDAAKLDSSYLEKVPIEGLNRINPATASYIRQSVKDNLAEAISKGGPLRTSIMNRIAAQGTEGIQKWLMDILEKVPGMIDKI
ncbi:MAG: hypothetical protein M1829_004282 [Trizodia sp. TS-e1964]|nr:MAG: hypothetical protein M1829_004282 [Trizodia sp. TS-e1964]